MDGESSNKETSGSTETTAQTDTNNNNNQTDEPELEESKDPGREPPAEETPEGQGATKEGEKEEKVKEDSVPEQGGEEEASAGDTDKAQTTPSKHVDGDATEVGQDKDKASTDVNMKDTEPTSKEKDGEGEKNEDKKGEQVEEVKSCETGGEGEDVTDKNKEKKKSQTEEKAEEAEKDVSEKAAKGAEKKKQVEEVNVETKDKGKPAEVEKQAKPKRKSGPPSSALSRPRQSARSIRAAARNDIIAKFQKGAPETPIARNFKIQKSASAGATGATIKQKILHWCQNKTRRYEGVEIENFSSSWSDGMAFCALIHRYFPDAFDFSSLNSKEREKNFTLAFQTAESLADCYPLLEVKDMLMMGNNPDPMCVFTYVQSLCQSLSKIEKERKDKETAEKDKRAGDEGEEKGEDAAGEASPEKDEGESAETEMTESQEEKQEDVEEAEAAGEEENAPDSCETEGDGGMLVKAES